MNWATYDAMFRDLRPVADLRVVDEVTGGGRTYPLWCAQTDGAKRLLITAGFHGDEVAGPLTLLKHLPQLVAYAKRRGVGLTVFPCVNPSGFDVRTRYNASGEAPNNDFLRYKRDHADPTWVDQLQPGQTFVAWRPFFEGPSETRAMARLLAELPTPDAMLDVHQDPWLSQPGCYAYVFGNRELYRPLLTASTKHLPVAANAEVDDDLFSDSDGLLELHDGSITDLFWRRGTPYVATLETTTMSPLPACHQVNLVWLRAFVDLAAAAKPKP